MTQKFKTGDEVRFSYEDNRLVPSVWTWEDGNQKGKGIIEYYYPDHSCSYELKVDGRTWHFTEKALRSAKPVQKFQEGDEVEFTVDDRGTIYRATWVDDAKRGRGIVREVEYDQDYKNYFCKVEIFEPVEYKARRDWFMEKALRSSGATQTSIQPSPTPTKPVPTTASTEEERVRAFFLKPKEEDFGTCDKCGSKLKPIGFSAECPRCG